MDFSASISRQNNSGGLWDSFALRGFPGNENMPSAYLVDGFSAGRGFSGTRDLANVAYIEVLKGPGSALYGRSEPGGTVNIITKKPQYQTEGYLKAELGRFQHQRLEGDFTTGLSERLAFRINGAWQDSDSFRDQVFIKKKLVSPSLRYQLAEDAALLYSGEFIDQQQLFDRGLVVLDGIALPDSRYLGEPDDGPTQVKGSGHQLNYQQQLAGGWSLQAGLNLRHSTLNGYSSDAELSPSRQSLFEDGRSLDRQRRYRDYHSDDSSLRLELSGALDTGPVRHHLLLGSDAYRYELATGLYRYRGPKGSYSLDILAPQYGQNAPEVALLYDNREVQKAFGGYLQDQMDLSEQVKLLLGLRFDHYQQRIHELASGQRSQRSQSRLSPRLGLVYMLSDSLSLYGSYSEGFVPLSGTDYQGQPFGVEESQSLELGLKFELQAVSGTLALFDADKSNILVADPVNVGFSAPLGRARSRGLELDLKADLGDNLQARLSYAYLDTQTTSDSLNADWGLAVPKGSPLVNIPRHNLSLMLSQSLQPLGLDGDTGLSYRFVDSRLGDAADLSFRLAPYSLVGLFLHLQLDDNLKLALNLDNLFDQSYIDSSYNALWAYPGAPRNLKASLTYAF